MAGPLEGIKIIELTSVVLGPWAAQIMADMGADVNYVWGPMSALKAADSVLCHHRGGPTPPVPLGHVIRTAAMLQYTSRTHAVILIGVLAMPRRSGIEPVFRVVSMVFVANPACRQS